MTIMMGVTSYQRVTSRCSHWMEVRGVTNSWLRQNRISKYGQKWDIITPHVRGIIDIFSPEGVLMLPKGL